jgi:hypothetical protein
MTQRDGSTTTTVAYLPQGLSLVNDTTVVTDLVRNLQREMILFVIGPYEETYLSLYRNNQEIFYWQTTEQLSYKQLTARPYQHRTLAYPQDYQQQCESIRTLILNTFFALGAGKDTLGDQKPAGAVSLTTVREINKAIRAHGTRTGGRVCCLCEGSAGVIQVFHAKQPRGASLQVAGSNGYWFTPGEVWVEP